MALQYNEFYHRQTGLTIGIEQVLFSKQSSFQNVEIYQTDTWGKLLVIDGMVMLSEHDEFVYHEMLSHVPLNTHPDPRQVLIIGGGDGGTAREVLRHPSIEQVDLVEIDETVIQACQDLMPEIGDWNNPKLNVRITNGIEHIKESRDRYDVILVDGSDPVGPAVDLFRKEFYTYCHQALRDNGVMATQCESPWVASYYPHMKEVYDSMNELFAIHQPYLASIPLYPAGLWCFMLGSKSQNPLNEQAVKRAESNTTSPDIPFRYYNPEIHQSAFSLPEFVREIFLP